MLPRCGGVGITVRTEAQVGSLAVYYQVILGLPSPVFWNHGLWLDSHQNLWGI